MMVRRASSGEIRIFKGQWASVENVKQKNREVGQLEGVVRQKRRQNCRVVENGGFHYSCSVGPVRG